ncbi:MAG TPA: hypothetical protein VGI97_12490 [Gemmatimonadaceae bacterium]
MRIVLGLLLIAFMTVVVLFMINGIGLFAPSKRPQVESDPEVLTGHIARVTAAIGAAHAGVVVYTLEGRGHDLPAVSLDGTAIPPGVDVVIGRIEDGCAFVERWEVVEGRI